VSPSNQGDAIAGAKNPTTPVAQPLCTHVHDHVGLGKEDSVYLSVASGHTVSPTQRALHGTPTGRPPNIPLIPCASQQRPERYKILLDGHDDEELTYDELCARFDKRIYTYIAPTMFKLKPSVERISTKDLAAVKRESIVNPECDDYS
jgi:hypothetical protein